MCGGQKELQEIFELSHNDPAYEANDSTVRVLIVDIKEIKSIIHAVNPDAKFIFTISPVRYIRDGFTENNQSKGVLHLALKETLTEVDIYFPAYEIVLDELRDYRFFDRDMVHPNALAVDYVWEKFSHAFFDEKTIVLNKTIEN